MRVALLWFATMKNAKSTYASEWVLAARERFSRTVLRISLLPFSMGEPPLAGFNATFAGADTNAFGKPFLPPDPSGPTTYGYRGAR